MMIIVILTNRASLSMCGNGVDVMVEENDKHDEDDENGKDDEYDKE
jgi:hypothetical protein